MIGQGAHLPRFRGRSQHGEEITDADLAGRPALLLFYPYAFSPVCGSELREIAVRRCEFAQVGARLLAISCDSAHSLRAYAEQLSASVAAEETRGPTDETELGFTMLSDFWPHGEIASAFGAFDESRGVPRRASFFVDAAGTIRAVQAAEFHQRRDVGQTLALLRALS